MNPKVRERINVVVVPFASSDIRGKSTTWSLINRYHSELFILTNEQERRFHGRIRCYNGFNIIDAPMIPTDLTSQVAFPSSPVAISNSEYVASLDASGTKWNPSHPAYMRVAATTKNLGNLRLRQWSNKMTDEYYEGPEALKKFEDGMKKLFQAPKPATPFRPPSAKPKESTGKD